jgi:aminoglycoside phosphotransferase family enzyme/predicted kinase
MQAEIPAQQRDLVAWLTSPAAYDGRPVERIDTHGAFLFLAGDRVLKLKRAVTLPYFDFATLAARQRACAAELALNRRTAPDLYLGLRAITRDAAGRFALDGAGGVVDWAVEMKRFDQGGLFDRLAERGELTAEDVTALAREIVRFHAGAERAQGGAARVAAVIDINARAMKGLLDILPKDQVAQCESLCRAASARHQALLESRAADGHVRRCHGDLHLRNVVRIDGRPVIFDALESDDNLATIDVLYDFAFLLMDLERRGLRALANLALNEWVEFGGDAGGLALLPLFLALRAGVRAHVMAAQARMKHDDAAATEAREDLALALRFLAPSQPRLVAVGGLSGSGKSTLALGLAPHVGAAPGAIRLRSDTIRKRLAGVAREDPLGAEHYTAEASQRVYDAMIREARGLLGQGASVIVDAVFARPHERAAVGSVARDLEIPFIGLWVDAPPEAMRQRVKARRNDASDATVQIVERQLTYNVGAIDWCRIDGGGSVEATRAAALKLL